MHVKRDDIFCCEAIVLPSVVSYFFRWEERFDKYRLLSGSEVGVTGRLHFCALANSLSGVRLVAVVIPDPCWLRLQGFVELYRHASSHLPHVNERGYEKTF